MSNRSSWLQQGATLEECSGPPENISIRKAAPSDGAVLRLLLNELGYQAALNEISQTLDQLHQDPDCGILVLTKASTVIGVTLVYIAKSLTAGRSAVIAHLVITESERGQGLDRLLVDAAKQWTQQHDLANLRVGSQPFRKEAHQFYKKLGFSQYKTQHLFEYHL
jgi:GNAT superfamily N-acetyltransferase